MTTTAEIVERLRQMDAQAARDSGGRHQTGESVFAAAADHLETLARERDRAVEVLAEPKWQSVDRDNMEFAARITCWQMDRIRAVLAEVDTESEGENRK